MNNDLALEKPAMTSAEQVIADEALHFARRCKKKIVKRLAHKDQYPTEESPVSVFMAGSPGAGKTEAFESASI